MSRPRLLDLFCGAGGCSVGYYRAGFEVAGVDIQPHPDYPYRITVADARDVLADRDYVAGFDAVHASPPCQAHTTMSNRWRGIGGRADKHVDHISAVRVLLKAWGGPWVIENVPGARAVMRSPMLLHGGQFGLGCYRPRLFESNVLLWAPPEAAPPAHPVGVYGRSPDGRRLFTRADGTEQRAARSLREGQSALGVDWMSQWEDVTEAIPPAYTEFLGEQLIAHLGQSVSIATESLGYENGAGRRGAPTPTPALTHHSRNREEG